MSFKEYMSTINEDAAQEVVKLQSDIAMIDTTIQQRTAPLLRRKEQLSKQLAIVSKQAQADAKTQPAQAANPQLPQAGATASTATTPGSSGAQNPGSGTGL